MSQEFALTLDGTTFKITVDGNSILVDDQPFVVGFDDEGRVLVDGSPFEIDVEGNRAVIGGIAYELQVEGLGADRPGPSTAAPPVAAGEGAVTAIMPGKIIRVLVAEGDEVEEGDVLCILEAMKMENELKAPRAGTVRALHAEPGRDVEMGSLLAEIE